MKKKLLFLTTLFGLILIPKEVLAASLGLNCPSSVIVGENITCRLTAMHETISGVKGSISFSGMSYKSVSNLTGSNYFTVSSNGFDGAIDIASGSKALASYTFTTNSVGTAKINVTCSEIIDGTNFDTHSCSGASKTITIKAKPTSQPDPTPTPKPTTPSSPNDKLSQNNNLKSLSVDGYDLVKVDDNNYTLVVTNDTTSINVNAVAEDKKANISGIGSHELQVGENNIEVIIKSESGAENKINIKVTRKDGYYLEDLESVLKNDKLNNINITINADSKITKEQMTEIKNSKKMVSFNYFDENKKLIYSWLIDGKKIKDVKELITTVSFTAENIKEINKLSNYADGLYVNFKQSGDLPEGTKIKIYVGNKFDNGSIVNLYRYDNTNKLLSLITDNLKVIDGYIQFDIEHRLEHFVTMSNLTNAEKKSSSNNIYLIISIIEFIIILSAVIIYFVKFTKIRKDNNSINQNTVDLSDNRNEDNR